MSYASIGSEIILPTGDLARDQRTAFTKNISKGSNRSPSKKKSSPRRSDPRSLTPDYSIIVHCHMCWDWVWQRPQQFISRISRHHRVLFVETLGPDPELVAPSARLRTAEQYPNVKLLRLQFPCWRWSDGEYVDRTRRRLVQDTLMGPLAGEFDRPVQWFYDPMAVTAFAGQMGEMLTVYDCMDEMSKFNEAPPEILQREAELLARADVVFAGGRKLFESKSRQNGNCHFYGCDVDAEHFAKACSPEIAVPPAMAAVQQPALG